MECLKEALPACPHLIRAVDGVVRGGSQTGRFERRCLDPNKWHRCLETSVGETRVQEVAGTWADWAWPSAAETSNADDFDEPIGFPQGDSWTISCRVNVDGLQNFGTAAPGVKGQHATQVAEQCARDGRDEGAGIMVVPCTGHQKKVAGESLGRAFFPWVSFPSLSRAARNCGSPPGTKEFDMPNAVVHFALDFARQYGLDLPCFRRYYAFKAEWRKVVMSWFSLPEHDAKKALLMACFGFAFPSRATGLPVACPLLEGLAADAMKLRELLCQKFPQVLQAMKEAKKPRPETSTMAFLLFDKEHTAMRQFCDLLPKHGFALVGPVFDAVLAVPERQLSDGDDHTSRELALLADFESLTGITMQVKALDTAPPVLTVQRILDDILASNQGIRMHSIEHVPGCYSCIGTALLNLFPEEESSIKEATANLTEPISYQRAMQLCPQIAIEPISWAQAKQCTDGTCFLLHTSHASGADIGHAYGLKLVQAAMHIYSSTEEERIQTNASLLLDKLQNVPGIYIFNVHVLPNGDPAAKRRKKEYGTSIELQLKAGMECDSEETSWERLRMQLKDSMRKEVDREITRPGLSCTVEQTLLGHL